MKVPTWIFKLFYIFSFLNIVFCYLKIKGGGFAVMILDYGNSFSFKNRVRIVSSTSEVEYFKLVIQCFGLGFLFIFPSIQLKQPENRKSVGFGSVQRNSESESYGSTDNTGHIIFGANLRLTFALAPRKGWHRSQSHSKKCTSIFGGKVLN